MNSIEHYIAHALMQLILVCSLLMSVSTTNAAKTPKAQPPIKRPIIIGLYDLRPYSYQDNKEFKGEWVELYHLIFSELDLEYSFSILPPKRLTLQMRTGDIHLTLAPLRHMINDKRFTIRGEQLIASLKAGIITSSPLDGSIQETLDNNRILSIRGYNYDGVSDLAPRDNLVYISTHLQMVRLIISGRYQYGLSYENELLTLSETDRQKIQFHKALNSNMHFLTSVKVPNAELFSDRLDHIFRKFRDNGTLEDCCPNLFKSIHP